MSGRTWTYFRKGGTSLIRWLTVLILYLEGILAYGSIQEIREIPVFLSSSYPSHDQVREILRTEAELEDGADVCFFQDGGMDTVTDPDYGRSAQVLTGGIFGNETVYDWRLQGFSDGDSAGCAIDRETAEELFGSGGAVGRLVTCRGRTYQVRLVVPWKQRMLLYHPSDGESEYARVYIGEEKGEDGESTASRFLLRYGLSGTAAQGQAAGAAALAALVLLPAGMYGSLFLQAFRQRKKESPWLWTGICVFMAVLAFFLLWRNLDIPAGWLPGKWSDFHFWPERLRRAADGWKLSLMMPGTLPEMENVLAACKSMAMSLAALILYFLPGRKQEE